MKCDNDCNLMNSRIDFIDTLRAFGIVLMIMSHTWFGGVFDKFIHAFHMPMFFIISGFFFNNKGNRSLKEIFIRKVKSLLLPYAIFGLLQYLIWLIIYGDSGIDLMDPLKNYLWINTNLNMPIAGALWFLTCLFIIEILFLILRKNIKSDILLFVVIVSISIFGTLFTKIFGFRLPWAADASMVGLGGYYAGYEIKKHFNKKIIIKCLNFNLIETTLIFVLDSVLIFCNGYINMRTGSYEFIPLFWINAIGMTIVLWNVSRILNSWKTKSRILNNLNNWLQYIGKNSIVYLCLNQLMILIFSSIIDEFIVSNSKTIILSSKFIILICSLIVLNIITKLITKTKLKVIIGK